MVSQVFYYNQAQQYPQIQQDYKDIKKHVDKTNPTDQGVMYALESLPPVRRLSSLPDKIQNGDYAPAVGLASLALINFPEDCRDIKSAYSQLFEKGYKPKYDSKELQHPFSFFRGTLLHKFVDPNTAKNPELAEKLLNADTTLANTKFGKFVMKSLNTEISGAFNTSIEDIGHTKEMNNYVKALSFEGKGQLKNFGELTARAMTRTTKLGVCVLAALELPKIFKAMGHGNGIGEQAGNTVKQTAKSGINVASITAGIGYGGAIGAKKFGATGSIVGMGLGAIIGAFASNKLQDVIG